MPVAGFADPGIEESPVLPSWAASVASEVDIQLLRDVVVNRDIAAAFPAQAQDREFVAALSASVTENLTELRRYLSGATGLASIQLRCPLDFATLQARLRIPQTCLQKSYRVGFAAMWEGWTAALNSFAATHDLDRDETMAAAATLTAMVLRYQDHVASQVAETFTRAELALTRSRAHVRQRLVRELLRGDSEVLTPSDLVILGYDLDAEHLTVLFPEASEAAVSNLMTAVRAATSIHDVLVQPLDLGQTAVWLGRGQRWDAEAIGRVRRVLAASGMVACLAEPSRGVDGLRNGLAQARKVHQVHQAWLAAAGPGVPSVVGYAEVGLEILLLQDDSLARQFVLTELGPLSTGSAEASRLRETLAASLRSGSHVAAAEALQVHEHTVRNRLQKIEALIGHSMSERRTEMQVALRLLRLLDTTP